MFSTVRGHEFSWTLLPDEEAVQQQPEPENILNFMPFEESTYSTDPIIRDLENRVYSACVHNVLYVHAYTCTCTCTCPCICVLWCI